MLLSLHTQFNYDGNKSKLKTMGKSIAFGCYGGKYSHLDWLLPLLPPTQHFCDVFGGSTIKLSEATVTEYIHSNVALLKNMVARGYIDARTMLRRVAQREAWLANPVLMSADAEYATVFSTSTRNFNNRNEIYWLLRGWLWI
jgi:site-specific DNA-adenine methylase